MLKSLHSSKSYCECSTTKQKTENEENMLLRKSENNTTYIRARHVFIRRTQGGREKRREGRMATDKTWTILTPEPSKNQVAFLTRNSVAVAPVVAQCTNRCTRRKGIVNVQPTNKKTEKWRKYARTKNRKLLRNNPRAARRVKNHNLFEYFLCGSLCILLLSEVRNS